MSAQQTQEVMERYIASAHSDVSMMADDAVFTVMATGQENRGRDAIQQMLTYFYRQAFDATAEVGLTIYTDEHAVVEGFFVGRHTGEFAGIPATNRSVRVPLCVVYDVAGGQIARGRVYFEMPALVAQLTAADAQAPVHEPAQVVR
jgi:steroid delta-isomerase-like uncharacterized protein